jgi:hypothetical protein
MAAASRVCSDIYSRLKFVTNRVARPPKRDWRDWFIMATVMGGVGYGLYFVTKVCGG